MTASSERLVAAEGTAEAKCQQLGLSVGMVSGEHNSLMAELDRLRNDRLVSHNKYEAEQLSLKEAAEQAVRSLTLVLV